MKTKFSLQKKLVASFIVFLIVPLLLIGLLIHQSYYRFFLQKEIALSSQKIDEASASMDDYIWQVNQLGVDIALSSSIEDILLHFNPNRFIGPRVETKFFQDLFGVSKLDICHVQYLKVTRPDGQIGLSVGTTCIEPASMDCIFSETERKSLWCTPREIVSFSGDPISVISLYQRVNSSYKQQLLGIVRIDIPTSFFQHFLASFNYQSDSSLFLTDQEGSVISSSAAVSTPDLTGKLAALNWKVSFEDASDNYSIVDDSYVIYGKPLSNSWRIISIIPSAAIEKQAFSIKQYVFFVGGCGALFTLILYVLISFSITKPLRSLMQTINNIKSGNLNAVSNIHSLDEFGIISDNFNQMTSQMKELVRKNTAIQRQETISELLYLQSQIEPHFLYNTLDSIRFNARRAGAIDVSNQLEMLSDLFRYYTASNRKFVTFQDEFLHIENYLSIQKLRYKERLSYSVIYDQELRSLYTIKLILQPIVENAVIHGLDPKIENGHLLVSGKLSDKDIRIEITDDGVGFNPELLVRQLKDPDDSHIFALKNIDARLKLHFGKAYGMSINSQLDKGTSILLTLPVIKALPEGDQPEGDQYDIIDCR